MKTYVVRHEDITVVWYNDRVLSAWDDAGNSVNLFYAHAITKALAEGGLQWTSPQE